MALSPLASSDAGPTQRDKVNAGLAATDANTAAVAAEVAARGAAVTSLAVGQASTPSLIYRPGDRPDAVTANLATGALGIPGNGTIVVDPGGAVLRIAGAAIVGACGLRAIEDNRVYKARAVARRFTDTTDPAGEAVTLGLAWYAADKTPLSPPSTTAVAHLLTVDENRRQLEILIGRNPLAPEIEILIPPVAAVYFRPFVQTFGATTVTDIEVIEHTDVTDADVVSIDLDNLSGRVSSLEDTRDALPATIASRAFLDALLFG